MTDRTPKPPPTLEELEEAIRQRLITNGQHGALAEFGKYTAAVHERLAGLPVIGVDLATGPDIAVESVIDTATGKVLSTKVVSEPANPNTKPKRNRPPKATASK